MFLRHNKLAEEVVIMLNIFSINLMLEHELELKAEMDIDLLLFFFIDLVTCEMN